MDTCGPFIAEVPGEMGGSLPMPFGAGVCQQSLPQATLQDPALSLSLLGVPYLWPSRYELC